MSIEKYADIIHLSRPISKFHKPMPQNMRAAQFSPFAALKDEDPAEEEETFSQEHPFDKSKMAKK